MKFTTSLFSQILQVIPRTSFLRLVRECGAERHAKGFSSWDQYVAMLFCQLAQAKSLREISDGLAVTCGKLSHLGLRAAPAKSTLAYANAHRPWELFQKAFFHLRDFCRSESPGKKKKFRFKNKLLSLDSTTMDLCLSLFPWADFRQTKGAVKLHLLLDHDGYLPDFALITEGKTADVTTARHFTLPAGSIVAVDRAYCDFDLFWQWNNSGVFFVTRLKENAVYEIIHDRPLPQHRNVLYDQLIRFTGPVTRQKYPELLRRVVVWDEENQREIELLTNHLSFGATTIGRIYRDRWEIELFFKVLKQHLKIKTFVGTSPNALKTQIWTALIAVLLL
ncbi:MAG: IS4 family transposase, partial [Deltaproteobacteria bacterium]|nr:IS4 family transposase [Deltaproteobacteria bacterium]